MGLSSLDVFALHASSWCVRW